MTAGSQDYENSSLLSVENGIEGLGWNEAIVEQRSRRLRLRSYGFLIFLLTAVAVAALLVDDLRHLHFFRISSEGVVQLNGIIANWDTANYKVHAACPDDGGVCLCSSDGVFVKTARCMSWKYQVGDAILFGTPTMHFWFMKYFAAYASSMAQQSPIIHTGIVVSVPPLGIRQTPFNVIIAESIQPQGISKSTLLYAIHRYPWGSVYIRRVDPVRFPNFHSPARLSAMQAFANGNLGHTFDNNMINPLTMKSGTQGRYIPVPPSCADETRALDLYKQGGLSNWMCSQFVTWMWAFAGGLNTDYGAATPYCGMPSWILKDLQPFPGVILQDQYHVYDASKWMKPCGQQCFVALPESFPHMPEVLPDGTSYAIDPQKAAVEYSAR